MSEISLHLISCSIWPYRLKRCPFLQLLPVWLDLDVGPGALGSGLLSGWYFPKLQPPPPPPSPPPPPPIFGVSSSRQSSNGRFRHSRVRQGPVVQANLTLTSIWSKIDVINFAKSAFLQPINVFKPTPLEKFSLLISSVTLMRKVLYQLQRQHYFAWLSPYWWMRKCRCYLVNIAVCSASKEKWPCALNQWALTVSLLQAIFAKTRPLGAKYQSSNTPQICMDMTRIYHFLAGCFCCSLISAISV